MRDGATRPLACTETTVFSHMGRGVLADCIVKGGATKPRHLWSAELECPCSRNTPRCLNESCGRTGSAPSLESSSLGRSGQDAVCSSAPDGKNGPGAGARTETAASAARTVQVTVRDVAESR